MGKKKVRTLEDDTEKTINKKRVKRKARLVEQIADANNKRYGRSSEKLDDSAYY